VPVVIDLGAIFLAFCAFCVCWALLQAYSSTLGALIGHLADLSKNVVVLHTHPFGWLGNGLDKINHFVMLQLGNAVQGTSYAWHKLVGQIAAFVHEVPRVLNDLALASAQAWDYAYRHGIRQVVQVYTNPLGAALHLVQALVKDLQHTGHATAKAVNRVVVHDLPRITIRVTEQAKVATQTAVKATAGTVTGTLPRVKTLERDVSQLEQWVKANGRKLTEAGIVGLVAAALGRIGINWTRCGPMNRYGKNICGMNPQLLESLIADTVLILGTVDLVDFATGMQGIVEEAEGMVAKFWRA